MFSNAGNLSLSYTIFGQENHGMKVGKDDNGLEYIEFVEGQQKRGKEDCAKSLEIFCPLCIRYRK